MFETQTTKKTKLSKIHAINMVLLYIHVESIDKTSNWIFIKIILDICAIYIHHTDKLCRWLAFQFGVYTTWYLLYTSNVKYTVWWINKINQTLLISCLHTDIPQILWLYFTLPAYFVKSKFWSDKFIIAIISNSSHVSRFLCL